MASKLMTSIKIEYETLKLLRGPVVLLWIINNSQHFLELLVLMLITVYYYYYFNLPMPCQREKYEWLSTHRDLANVVQKYNSRHLNHVTLAEHLAAFSTGIAKIFSFFKSKTRVVRVSSLLISVVMETRHGKGADKHRGAVAWKCRRQV